MRWQGRMADDVAATRAMVGRAQALLEAVRPLNFPGQSRDADGQFAGGGSGAGGLGDDEDGGGIDTTPTLLTSASGGGRQVAAYTDPFEPDTRVIAVSEHGRKLGSLDDAEETFTTEQAKAIAGGLDEMAAVGREAPTPSGPDVDDGPVVLGSVERDGLRMTAFYDGGGDLGGIEGSRFVQVSEAGSDWRDPLRSASQGRLLDVDLGDASSLADALRQVTDEGA